MIYFYTFVADYIFNIMAQDIIGRSKEIAELQSIYRSGRPEFVIVRGRRRVGKTFLIREMFSEKFAFYHTGLSPAQTDIDKTVLHNQLYTFYASLVRYGHNGDIPNNWLQAFNALISLLEKKKQNTRQVVFIDELPWMDTPKSGFIPAFEHFWNGWGASRSNLMLIVCGSSTSWILDKIINNKGGLYNRTTFEIKLSPFTLKECSEFYKKRQIDMDIYDQIQAYMILGGVPYYMSLLRKERSLAQNIDDLFFAKNAKLKEEFDRLFNSLFTNPEANKNLVKQLSHKRIGLTRNEIAEASKLPTGGWLSDTLKGLEAGDFIISYDTYAGPKRDTHYKLTDSFCLFYLYFLGKRKTTNPHFWRDNLHSASLNAWRGYAFEEVCFTHTAQIKKALGISGVHTEILPWRSRQKDDGAQIDMVIIRDDRVINICELKFCSDDFTITKSYDKELRHKIELFSTETKSKCALHLTLITPYGLALNEYSGKVHSVVTAKNLIS